MQWTRIIREVPAIATNGDADPAVIGVEYDSRRVVPGTIFVAMRGGTTDGNRYIEQAIQQGAAAIVTDSSEAFVSLQTKHPTVPSLLVHHGRKALAHAASAFFDHPEKKLHSTGVTGTNGKTTTAFLIESLLNAAHRSTILVGTIEYHVAGKVRPSAHTTPESRDLFELMADGVSQGTTELVMEVSSHALEQGRVAEVNFDVAVFTNLTRDHLDFHGTMENYFAAKRLLFDGQNYPAPRVAILNSDDPHTADLAAASTSAGSELVTYGIHNVADWWASNIQLTPSGTEFTLHSPLGNAQTISRLAGEVNVLNLLAAVAASHVRGLSFETLLSAIPRLEPVPGRFQPVNAGQPFTVIVDYAHTDDALRNLTALAHRLIANSQGPESRVLTLFGCGGDRDRTKRPRMGLAAGQGSNLVIATSDNPRSEDPDAIIAEILPGILESGTPYIVEPDRAKAIAIAVSEAHPGDVVLIAGKGHEKTQTTREGILSFDDEKVSLSALRSLGYGVSL
jgi:UDP-N-acetylmuramoyl-L-alanyl-D-glutamate--2,6-diaminopimelate ligase